MIRNILILLSVIAFLGFAPAIAQDVFIKKNKNGNDDGEKPTLFIKPAVNSNSPAAKVNYKNKLKVTQLKKLALDNIRTLEDWKASGLGKPKTAQEIVTLARASRAAHQDIMYQRRAQLVAHLEKQNQGLQKQVDAYYSNSAALISSKSTGAFETPQESAGKAKEAPVAEKATPKKKLKPRVYTSPEDKAKPTKVFTNYR